MTKVLNEEALQLNEVLDADNIKKWYGPKPWLRFFHVALEEEVLIVCQNMSNLENREGIDGSNSSSRPKKFFELGSNKFNDPVHRPVSNMHPDLNDDFLEPIELFEDEEHKMPLVTPSKLKYQLSLVQCKVIYYFVSY